MMEYSKHARPWMAALGLTAFLLGASVTPAHAQAPYPQKPVRMIVGFPPGGTTDILARLIAEKLGGKLKQSVVVENQAGASGLIATGYVAKAPADGYTLLFSSSTHAIYPNLYKNVAFDPIKSFTPIGTVAATPYVLVVHKNLPVKNVAELLDYARKHPGEINYAGSSPGTAQHLSWELIKRMSKTDMQYIPYKGSADAFPDLRSGRLQAAIDNVAVMRANIDSGDVRPLAVTSKNPSSVLPGVPTIAPSGLPGFESTGWFGVFAPAGTPKDVVDTLSASLGDIMKSEDVKAKLLVLGAEPLSGSSEDLKNLLAREVKTWSEVIQSAHISAQ
jgi:tripartite-type tricarboxylate transporter receptor subunit TctC